MKDQCFLENCTKIAYIRTYCRKHYSRLMRYGDPLIFKVDLDRTIEERFWAFVDKSGDCWVWTGAKNEHGYGQIAIKQYPVKAHRYSYFLAHGRWPKPCCLHSCDNPPCVNPEHLYEGTLKDNTQDMVRRKRHAHGETSYAKLTENQALAIIADPRTHRLIAIDFGIERRTVGCIKQGRIWKHLPR